jgi:hypothetical protein
VSVAELSPSLTIASWSHSSVSNSDLLHPLKNGAGAADPEAAGADGALEAAGAEGTGVAEVEASAGADDAESP